MYYYLISFILRKYSSGPAEVYFGGKAGGIRGLTLTFDSGSSYTYFNSQVYGAVEKLLKNDLKGQPLKLAPDDKTLELCWKGPKAFKSVSDVRDFFKPLALNFKNSKNAQFQIPSEAYLIISIREVLGDEQRTISDSFLLHAFFQHSSNSCTDISMLNKIVVYDNQRRQIGWAPQNCNPPPRNEAAYGGSSKRNRILLQDDEMRMSNLFPVFVLFAAFVLSLSGKLCFADRKPSVINRPSSSIVFPVKGNVYPLGHFTASVNVGNPPKVFDLDIDTGSDVTWVQCDAPCTGCTLPRDKLYKPHNNVVRCGEPLCAALFHQGKPPCRNPNDQCDYQIEYADHGSSIGVLVKDLVPMKLANGTVIAPNLGFGCGYDQHNGGSQPPPSTGGVLGLGNSKGTLASQISSLTHVRNVIGHCYSGHGGGFLFFGGDLVPSSGISWTPILHTSGGRYSSGPADVFFGGKAVGIRGLTLTFDSGSSYTYFNSQVYGAILNTVRW
ncbi:Aspartic proteinase Asp1, partial [Cucurbita argyrosperma subsp. argyrosperma]